MILGVFGRVVSWPLGYIQVAMNAKRLYLASEVGFIVFQAALVAWWVPRYGALGAAYAFFACYVVYFAVMCMVASRLLGFGYSPATIRMIVMATMLLAVAMLASHLLSALLALAVGALLALGGGVWCMRELAHRVGHEHRLIRLLLRVPGLAYMRWIRDE